MVQTHKIHSKAPKATIPKYIPRTLPAPHTSHTPPQPAISSQAKRVAYACTNQPPLARSLPRPCAATLNKPNLHHTTSASPAGPAPSNITSHTHSMYVRYSPINSVSIHATGPNLGMYLKKEEEQKSICRSCHSHACSLAHSHAHTLHYSYIDNWPAQNTAKKKQSP